MVDEVEELVLPAVQERVALLVHDEVVESVEKLVVLVVEVEGVEPGRIREDRSLFRIGRL